MNFEKEKQFSNFSFYLGFLVAYFFFTTIVYLVTTLSGKFPQASYFNFMLVTSAISYLGLLLNKLYS
jgi:hypothetical protein